MEGRPPLPLRFCLPPRGLPLRSMRRRTRQDSPRTWRAKKARTRRVADVQAGCQTDLRRSSGQIRHQISLERWPRTGYLFLGVPAGLVSVRGMQGGSPRPQITKAPISRGFKFGQTAPCDSFSLKPQYSGNQVTFVGGYPCFASTESRSISSVDPAGFEPASATVAGCCVPVTPRAPANSEPWFAGARVPVTFDASAFQNGNEHSRYLIPCKIDRTLFGATFIFVFPLPT